MTKKKIIVVGGGVAGLTAAYYMQRTQSLRDQYEVTVHQLGWRLGGKLASGRNEDVSARNEEHGLHVWFGFYENAFRMMGEVYDRWKDKPDGFPYRRALDAFLPQDFTPVGKQVDGKWSVLPVHWPNNTDEPGQGGVFPSPGAAFAEFISLFRAALLTLLDQWILDHDQQEVGVSETIASALESLLGDGAEHALSKVRRGPAGLLDRAVLAAGSPSLGRIGVDLVLELLRLFARWVESWIADNQPEDPADVDANTLRNAIDVGLAFFSGLTNPDYGIVEHGWDVDRINHLEFREWLIANGASSEVVNNWSVIRALYETGFFYDVDGGAMKPNLEAGTAARIMVRICATFKGSVLYLPNAGLGEVFAAPMYELLREYGVRFEFFSKLSGVSLDEAQTELKTLTFARQASAKSGDYRPTRTHDGLRYWPSEPYWDQLLGGDAMKAAGVDFESHWCTWPTEPHELRAGRDFDHVVLAMSLGSFKRLNDRDSSPLGALLDASPELRAAAEGLPIVPTLAAQFWFVPDLSGTGWPLEKPATVAWVRPLDIWADMSQVLESESWGENGPKSLGYLCGVMNTDLYRRPASESGVPAEALAEVRALVERQLDAHGGTLWPALWSPGEGFDWAKLAAPAGVEGVERLYAQYLRANVDPSQTCVGSPVGATKLRPEPDGLSISNVTLSGAWIHSGLNATSVECATMTGMAAARAVTGLDVEIVGEHFMAAQSGE